MRKRCVVSVGLLCVVACCATTETTDSYLSVHRNVRLFVAGEEMPAEVDLAASGRVGMGNDLDENEVLFFDMDVTAEGRSYGITVQFNGFPIDGSVGARDAYLAEMGILGYRPLENATASPAPYNLKGSEEMERPPDAKVVWRRAFHYEINWEDKELTGDCYVVKFSSTIPRHP